MVSRSRCRKWAVSGVLLLAGFVLPSTWMGHATLFGWETYWYGVDYYDRHVFFGEDGFFSRGLIVIFHWEETHGNNFGRMLWLPGMVLAGSPALLGVLLTLRAFLPSPKAAKTKLTLCIVAILFTLTWLWALMEAGNVTGRLLASEYHPYWGVAFIMFLLASTGTCILFALNGRRLRNQQVFWSYPLRMYAQLLLIYLAWVVMLQLRLGTLPFLGLPLTMVGAVCLWVFSHRHISQEVTRIFGSEGMRGV